MSAEGNSSVLEAVVAKMRPQDPHELPLAAMKSRRATIKIDLMDGRSLYGNVNSFDRWTISLVNWWYEGELPVGRPKTWFKHAIAAFEEARNV